MERRDFVKLAAGSGMAAALAPNLMALAPNNAYRNNIGIQLYTLRKEIGKDAVKTLAAVAEAGYKQVEAYGFPGPLATKMINGAKAYGMQVNSSHFNWESVTNPTKKGVMPFEEVLNQAKQNGLSHLVIPYLHAGNRKTLDDYKRLVEFMNKGAVQAKKAGIQLAYHNHAFEYQPLAGDKSGYDVMIEGFAPEMKFEIDVFWVKVAGVDPVEQIQALKGRVSQLHLKDLKKDFETPNFGKVPKDAFEELGDGMIDMNAVIEAAAEVGVSHCHVEQDQSPDALASVKQSFGHLKQL